MYRVVKIDESQYITDEDLLRRAGGKIYSVYIYNDGEATHLCEFTPSYWLHEVDVVPEQWPDYNDDDRLYDDLLDCRNDEYGIYVHCHQVDKLKSAELGEFESMEDAVEYYQGNPLY